MWAPSGLRVLALAVGVAVLAVASVVPAEHASAAGERPPSAARLRAQRAQLLHRIAALTDEVERRQVEVLDARRRRLAAEAAVAEARHRLREHAITAYIHAGELAAARARSAVYADVMEQVDRDVLERVRTTLHAARAHEQRGDAALFAAREAAEELDAARRRLEATLRTAEHMEAEARRNAAARQQAVSALDIARRRGIAPHARHVRATEAQAALMARWPFGPVTGIPAGLRPTGAVVEGMASWYGPGFDGRATASGAIYDQEGWTVASRELPLGTLLVITRGDRSVLALVNDRGPYVAGRVLDLSHGVAQALGTVRAGVAAVRAEVVVPAT